MFEYIAMIMVFTIIGGIGVVAKYEWEIKKRRVLMDSFFCFIRINYKSYYEEKTRR